MFETSFGAVEKALLQSHRIPDALAGASGRESRAYRSRAYSGRSTGLGAAWR